MQVHCKKRMQFTLRSNLDIDQSGLQQEKQEGQQVRKRRKKGLQHGH